MARPARRALPLPTALTLALTLALLVVPARARAFKLGEAGAATLQPAIVEGTARKGGIQPDFVVDEAHDPELRGVLAEARAIGARGGSRGETVSAVFDLVRRSLTWANGGRPTAYDDPSFRGLLATYRESGRPIPLGEYARHGLGDCRAHFLLMHVALLRAGVDNEAVYASIHGGPASQEPDAREGHGFVVLRGGGASDGRVVDSYFAPFDGVRLKDLETSDVVPEDGERASLRVHAIRPYPLVHAIPSLPSVPSVPRAYPPAFAPAPAVARPRAPLVRWVPARPPSPLAPRPFVPAPRAFGR